SLSFDQKELVFAESGRIRTTSSIKRSDSGCDTADGAAASWEHGRPVRSGLGARTSRPLRAGSTDVPSAVSSIDHDCGSDNGGAHGLDCVDVSARRISNGIFTLQIDEHANMLVTARHKDNQIVEYGLNLKFQDIGDGGDSYNFDPIKDDVPIVARLKSVSPHLLGPLVGSLRLIHEIDIPESAVRSDDRAWLGSRRDLEDLPVLKRSKGVLRHELITDVILKRGVPIVFFDTSWQNLASDHRLEVLIDTGAPVKTTWSENHFCLIERKLAKNVVDLPVGRAEEAPLDRFACQRFFLANKQVFLNAGLSEYAVEGNKVAYTILRAVSMLSRKRLLTRGGGAGPHMPVPEANCPGLNQVSFGWAPLAVLSDSQDNCINDADIAAAYIFAESFEDPLWLSPMGRGGGRETDNLLDRLSTWHCQGNHFKALALNDQNVRVTALYSQDGGKSFLLRLLNTSPLPRSCRLDIYMPVKKVELVSLSGKRVKTSRIGRDGSLNLAFGKNELLTLKLTPAGDALPGPQPEPEPE
ncbi:MAG: hypothetical protein K8F91_14400, partial [Candidatus Obscuribacterales bacterium]|nr:hypothetical protein [Candidatus Obscuribacterales bacterium]